MPFDQRVPQLQFDVAAIRAILQRGGGAHDIFQLALSSFTSAAAEKLKLEVMPGAEFSAAAQESAKYGGALVLGDRSLHVTLSRAWAALGFWQRIRLLYALVSEVFSVHSWSHLLAKAITATSL